MAMGVNSVVHRARAWRIGNLEHTGTWLPDVDQIHASGSVRFTSGFTLRNLYVVIVLVLLGVSLLVVIVRDKCELSYNQSATRFSTDFHIDRSDRKLLA